MVCGTLQGLWMISDKIVDFQFLVKFDRSWLAIILRFLYYKGACYLCIKKAPNQAKDLINMVCVTLEGLWMIANGIVDISIFRQISQVCTCNNFQFFIFQAAC